MLTTNYRLHPSLLRSVLVLKCLSLLLMMLLMWLGLVFEAQAAAPVEASPPLSSEGTALMTGTTITSTAVATPAETLCPVVADPETVLPPGWSDTLLDWAIDWSGQLPGATLTERVNILLMGSDSRTTDKNGRTDSLILVTVDPLSQTAAMLSIPRDLWVVIPGYGENRINMAYRLGQLSDVPGGGPALVVATVEANLGVPVDYYGVINFEGFANVIDVLGGVGVCVPETLDAAAYYGYPAQYVDRDNYYSFVPVSAVEPPAENSNNFELTVEVDANRGYEFLYIEAGWHQLDGQTALRYARSRASVTADFARVQRQQAVLLAMRHQMLQINVLPQIPTLWQTMTEMYDTNLQLAEVLQLARVAYTIPRENIQTAAISHEQTLGYRTKNGASVLLPRRTEIKALVDRLFGTSTPTAPPTQLEFEAGLSEQTGQ